MKKLLFFIVLSGIAFKIKAQQKSSVKPFEKLFTPDKSPLFDSVPKLSFKQKNDVKALFLPTQKTNTNSFLIAELDHMPVVKPVGNWKTPVARPDETVLYTMPVKRLPLRVKPEITEQKTNP